MINKLTLEKIQKETEAYDALLLAVTKTHPEEVLREAYALGLRHFGENKVQELESKALLLPNDIQWHLIGHLQTNKIKMCVPHTHLIHSVDSQKLIDTIQKEGERQNKRIDILLQLHIAQESTKFGLTEQELESLCGYISDQSFSNITIKGLMGMASLTSDTNQIRNEFKSLRRLFERYSKQFTLPPFDWKEVSMGMTSDYKIALEEGSTMIRVGSAIFGTR
ncbi:MAG: YggS family pyridoxal phosphate-dependent enzyme [Cytophagaceae bacterium]|jgi:hypothetical protein|nr:YggS family pyridoxal phosphate-dependent enzyme [Cytophagaceae bacterium]